MYDRLRQDNARILGQNFSLPVVFSHNGTEYPAQAFATDSSFGIDANGMPCVARRVSISVNLVSATGVVQFTTENNPSIGDGWRASFTYNGESFSGLVKDAMFDRTLAMVSMFATRIKAA